jgi:hypothetical protein
MKLNQEIQRSRVRAAANVCVECCQKLATQIKAVKEGFGAERRPTLAVPDRMFRLALNEAEALAWQTGYPHLLFPALATEKIQAATEWSARQKLLRQKKSGPVMSS